jgi:hypothetical protein
LSAPGCAVAEFDNEIVKLRTVLLGTGGLPLDRRPVSVAAG